MRRRQFIAMIGGAATTPVLWRQAAHAQERTISAIGFLGGADPTGYRLQMEALRLGLRDHGYVEGKNIAIEYRWAEGKYDRLPALAAELVRLNVQVIITQGTPAAIAAKQATTTIPIVMTIVGNPIENGIVTSLARPGGNITGSSFFMPELCAKRLELIKNLIPSLTRPGVLINPDNPVMRPVVHAMEEMAQALDLKLHRIYARRSDELGAAFDVAKAEVEALTFVDEGLFIANAGLIAELAMSRRLPSIGLREHCEAGALASYGVSFPHIWRQAMASVDKILHGSKPADLPIQQATRFEFVINLRTAKALGLTIPPALLARADEVIE
jgi:putative tryptophan/tyrosine transport system substrate-binding protein